MVKNSPTFALLSTDCEQTGRQIDSHTYTERQRHTHVWAGKVKRRAGSNKILADGVVRRREKAGRCKDGTY